VLTLSKGPVCPSDAIGRSDAALIMRSAMADGTLLQPSRPATMIDTAFVAKALGAAPSARHLAAGGLSRPSGQVWFAPSRVAGRTFGSLLVADLASDHQLMPAELGLHGRLADGLLAVEANASSTAVLWGVGLAGAPPPLPLRACGRYDFQLFSLAAREANGWALVGEVGTKWVAASPARFAQARPGSGTRTPA
jgi:hypothetical protein